MAKSIVLKQIKNGVGQFRDRIASYEDRINLGQRPRRGIGTSGLKKDNSHYKLGGIK